jgi:putative two-component system response regulator
MTLSQQEAPNLILLDVRMPDVNGIQVLEHIKKAPGAPPVIMITADPPSGM